MKRVALVAAWQCAKHKATPPLSILNAPHHCHDIMQSTFHSSETGQAIIQNRTTVSTEQLVISLHQGSDSIIEVQIKELVPDSGAIISTISVNRDSMQKMVDWLRAQEAIN